MNAYVVSNVYDNVLESYKSFVSELRNRVS